MRESDAPLSDTATRARRELTNTEAYVSQETHAALEDAVRDHFADEFADNGGMATGWVLHVSGVLGTDAESSAHLRETPSDQPVHVTLGMLEYARIQFRQLILNDDDEDD